jgi:hypothetical protein
MPYVTQSPDTSEAAERVQVDILRRLGRRRRWEMGLRLVDEGFDALWRALKNKHPGWTREQLLVEWVRVHYDDELAARYAEYLQCKNRNSASFAPP